MTDLANIYDVSGEPERDDQGRTTPVRQAVERQAACLLLPVSMDRLLRAYGNTTEVTHEAVFNGAVVVRMGHEVDVVACVGDPSSVGKTFLVHAARPWGVYVTVELKPVA